MNRLLLIAVLVAAGFLGGVFMTTIAAAVFSPPRKLQLPDGNSEIYVVLAGGVVCGLIGYGTADSWLKLRAARMTARGYEVASNTTPSNDPR